MSLAATSVWHRLSVDDLPPSDPAGHGGERLAPRLVARSSPAPVDRDADPGGTLAQPFNPRSVLRLLNKAADVLEQGQARCLGVETRAEEAAALRACERAEAQRLLEAAKADAAASRAQVEDLQRRLAEAETVTMELRSRLVCLTGKLAASADMIRYQSLSRALVDGPGHPPSGDLDASAVALDAARP